MATMNVLDAAGSTVAVEKPLVPGRAAAAASRPVALSNEDAAFLDGIEGQLTTLATKLDSVIAAVDGLEGFTDGIEGLIGTTNTNLTTIDGRVDGLEGLLASTNTKLDTLNTAVASTADTPVEVHSPGDIITVTPTLDTSIYASGDVLFTTTAISNAVRANDGIAQLQSLVIVDKDDQKPEIALKFWSSNVTYGAFNGVPSISDSEAIFCLGRVNIVTADYDDDGGVSTAFKDNIGKMLKPASGTRTIYITGKLTSGTPTHTASGLVIRLALLWG